jgi:type VI secretion system protein ImpH
MATKGGTENSGLKDSPLERALRENAPSFEFFQAVTLLQRLEGRQPIGRFSDPQDEAVRFHVNNHLAFPASQIQQLEASDDAPYRMLVNFMGLTGPLGVLPYCYSELILERARDKDDTLAQFFDIFNHRMISFFYRAWERFRFPVTYSLGEEDTFTHHLFDLIGLGTSGLQQRQTIPDEALLHYVGILAMQSRSAMALEQIIADYFDVPVEVEQFAGAWYRLDSSTQSCLREGQTLPEQLGGGAVVGDEIWNQQSRIRIKLGPLDLPSYLEFLPAGSAFEPLRAITKFFANEELDFEVQLILKREEVPSCEVGSVSGSGPRLGWVTWLKSVPMGSDQGDTVLNL